MEVQALMRGDIKASVDLGLGQKTLEMKQSSGYINKPRPSQRGQPFSWPRWWHHLSIPRHTDTRDRPHDGPTDIPVDHWTLPTLDSGTSPSDTSPNRLTEGS